MSLFISTYKNKIDKKLRVSVPSQFRSVISKSSFAGIIVYRSITNKCLEGCSLERLEKITEMIDSLDPFSSERDAFSTAILGGSIQLSFDTEGRVNIPDDIIAELGLTETAVFVGKGHTFEIWSNEEFEKHISESRKIAFENRDKIKVIK
ncbi:division/cell wall cluster transcriptional repressor MraZ [Candidatus Deianiraea vastatrix]|uniref:Transcriptional regulator MraZ n=1 Tax=Candidatus Deianiraea vastatrix TaxID=2163644 RepID=A0A5B8XF43_9RICK|nr:cell division/cell wall cluster transcriptional repressor MraZ [Candidatus Deianiraea vastatrix]QED22971.1 Protein MraZ [Candidatus Deianiraea vastatrix]